MKEDKEELSEMTILENKINYLERRIRILEVLVGKFATICGIKVESFQDGLVVISELTEIG